MKVKRRWRSTTSASERGKNDVSLSNVFHKRTLNIRTDRARRLKRARTYVRIARVARLAERTAPLIVPNRPAERSATHGLAHGRLRAPAAKYRDHRDFTAESDDDANSITVRNIRTRLDSRLRGSTRSHADANTRRTTPLFGVLVTERYERGRYLRRGL
jgi:hypothetical protein